MRNQVVVNLYKMKNSKGESQVVAHFCRAAERPAVEKSVEIEIRVGEKGLVTAPDKLQGNDWNLVFPLTATKSVQALDFNEIESIMCFNNVAANVTRVEKMHKDCIDLDLCDWLITYNQAG